MVSSLVYVFAAVLVVALAIFAVGMRSVLRASRTPTAADAEERAGLIAREVVDAEGQRVGETIRVEGPVLVVAGKGRFYVVPRDALVEEGEKLRGKRVDWAEAERRGETWRKEHEDVMAYDEHGMPVQGGGR